WRAVRGNVSASRHWPPWARCRRAYLGLLKCDFGKTSELARMQALGFLVLEPFERLQADLEMLTDAPPVEFAGHAGELDFAVQRLVGDAQQSAVGDAEAIAVGGDCRRLHVERDSAGL